MMRVRKRIAAVGVAGPAVSRSSITIWVGRRIPRRLRRGIADDVLGSKIFLAGAGLFVGSRSSHGAKTLASAAILGGVGWRWPEIRERRRSRARARAVLASLPDMLDLLAACARAGSSVGRAFELAAERDKGPLGDAMRDAVRALAHGLPRDAAYDVLCERADIPEVRRVVSALKRAERLGTSIADTASDLARDVREERRARAEEDARGAPVRVLFPVVACFLPAFGLLTVAPVIIVALRSFRS
ncbi:MAG: type II secretion system F family protein [Actinomycetota bacterium]|nr:type II secretion system F family protein [Actinomycetota bacterium]